MNNLYVSLTNYILLIAIMIAVGIFTQYTMKKSKYVGFAFIGIVAIINWLLKIIYTDPWMITVCTAAITVWILTLYVMMDISNRLNSIIKDLKDIHERLLIIRTSTESIKNIPKVTNTLF